MEHVDGPVKPGKVILYALSTCPWCKKTRALLEELGVAYDYEYVDLAPTARQNEIESEIAALGGRPSYPAIIFEGRILTGYRPDEIKTMLRL